jgi:hypothetical protein
MFGEERIVVQKGQSLLETGLFWLGSIVQNTTLLNAGSDILAPKSLIRLMLRCVTREETLQHMYVVPFCNCL